MLMIAVIMIVSVILIGQSIGLAGPHMQAESPETDPALAVSAGPPVDWALGGLLLGGALITLFRPRRRKITKEDEK
jgi:hypothetical protein